MQLGSPVFLSFQVGDAGVYSRFVNKCTIGISNYDIDIVTKSVIEYINNTQALIGVSLYGRSISESGIIELLQKCFDRDIKVAVDLSCNKMDIEFFNRYEKYFDLVRVSIYSLEPEKHNRMFEQNEHSDVLDFINSVADLKKGKVLVIPLLEDNWSEISDIAEFSVKHGFKINPLPIPRYCINNQGSLSNDSFVKLLEELSNIQNLYENQLYLDVPAGYKYFNKPSICPALRLSIDIGADGTVRPCKFSNISLGSIGELKQKWTTFKEIWNKSDKCTKCSEQSKCGGGCLANKQSLSDIDDYCLTV